MTYQPKHFQFDRFSEWKEDWLREEMEASAKVPVIRDDGQGEFRDVREILGALYPKKGPVKWSDADRAIRVLNSENRTMTTAEIAAEIGVTSKSLSGKLDRWARAGYLISGKQTKSRGRMVNTWQPVKEAGQ